MAVASSQRMTAEEFLDLPYDPEKLPHAQLIDGVIVVNAPSPRHQRIIFWLGHQLMPTGEATPEHGEAGLEVDTPIDEWNVYAPDLWWMPYEDRLARDAKRFDRPAPLIVEVRSPSTWRFDVGVKKRRYEEAGVAELWLVDTAADVVLVFRRSTPISRSSTSPWNWPPTTPSPRPSGPICRSTSATCSTASPTG